MPNPLTSTLLGSSVSLALLGFTAGVTVALTLALALESYRFYVVGDAEEDEA